MVQIPSMPLILNKDRYVKDKFLAISPKYDLINSLLSLGIDRYWRKEVLEEIISIKGEYILDLCAGTLSLSAGLIRDHKCKKRIVALDFCLPMLLTGRRRISSLTRREKIYLICGDGQQMPFPDQSFHGIMVAFGIRNFSSTLRGLKEMYRVLKPGGKAVILEFSMPTNPFFRPAYSLYLRKVLPFVGGLISGDKEAYHYLSQSIGSFYRGDEWISLIKQAGFREVTYREMTLGIVTLSTGRR